MKCWRNKMAHYFKTGETAQRKKYKYRLGRVRFLALIHSWKLLFSVVEQAVFELTEIPGGAVGFAERI
jgi:hypothetical protein